MRKTKRQRKGRKTETRNKSTFCPDQHSFIFELMNYITNLSTDEHISMGFTVRPLPDTNIVSNEEPPINIWNDDSRIALNSGDIRFESVNLVADPIDYHTQIRESQETRRAQDE